MMDVLVQVAASHRLSPPRHTLQIEDGETGRSLDYKANQMAGSLPPNAVVHLVDKTAARNSHAPVLSSQTEVRSSNLWKLSWLNEHTSKSHYISFITYLSSKFTKVIHGKKKTPEG